jgi:chaperonin GroEL
MEESNSEETYMDVVDGVQIDSGLISSHFITDKDKQRSELDNPLVLIVSSEIPNVRRIQNILEHVIKTKRALLIVAPVAQQLKTALLMNKVKGNIEVNIIDPPGFGNTKQDTIEDLAIITGAKVMNEELGDDLELIHPDCLGEVVKSVTDDKNTVLTVDMSSKKVKERIKSVKNLLKEEKNGFLKEKLQQRLAMLSGSVGIVFVGANSAVELKEKKDRVDDAIYATKAALQEGIVSGGGIALLNAANTIKTENIGEKILFEAVKAPFKTILANAGIENYEIPANIGEGYNVITGETVNMIKTGIIDPVLVTKTALKNAISVVNTIVSADCVISNMRMLDESGK